jgi:hypothetical protein
VLPRAPALTACLLASTLLGTVALGAGSCGGTTSARQAAAERTSTTAPSKNGRLGGPDHTSTSAGPASAGSSQGSSRPAQPAAATEAAVSAAVAAYQRAHGVPRNQYLISGVRVSGADASWAEFSVVPAAGYANAVQGGYGFAHLRQGAWRVVAVGNAQVGCPPGPTVPPHVLSAAGLGCTSP